MNYEELIEGWKLLNNRVKKIFEELDKMDEEVKETNQIFYATSPGENYEVRIVDIDDYDVIINYTSYKFGGTDTEELAIPHEVIRGERSVKGLGEDLILLKKVQDEKYRKLQKELE